MMARCKEVGRLNLMGRCRQKDVGSVNLMTRRCRHKDVGRLNVIARQCR
jgi:hypothetical protein